jgi:DNA-binding NtrC family response regulator
LEEAVPTGGSDSARRRPRVLVAGTADAIEALVQAVKDAAEIVTAESLSEALYRLDSGPFDTIVCNVRFDESRMFEFLQAVTQRDSLASARIVSFRAEDTPLSNNTRKAIRNALEALGVEHFVDLAQLSAEYGEDVAYETLRKLVVDAKFAPPAPTGQ